MRISFDLRLVLSEGESTALALAAYHANLSISDFIKNALEISIKSPRTESRVLAPEAMPAVAPPPVPPVEPVEPVEATEQPPAPPPPPAPAASPPPTAQPATPPPVKQRKPRVPNVEKVGVPRGFYRILEVAERLNAGRRQVIQETGSTRGHAYVMAMSNWLKTHGFEELDGTTRFQLNTIGQDAPAIRRWFRTLPPGTYDNTIVPYTVMKDWLKHVKQHNGAPPEMEGGVAEEGVSEPGPGPTSSAADSVVGATPETDNPADTTLYFSPGGGVERRPLSAITGIPPGATLVKSRVELEPSKQPTKYDSFATVDLDQLNSYDSRKLRQFTERLVNLVGSDRDALSSLQEAEVALAIRKIRGNEGGDVPPTAAALARMGVIIDPKVHKLRREFIERYPDVRKWAEV